MRCSGPSSRAASSASADGLLLEQLELAQAALAPLGGRGALLTHALEPHGDAVCRGARRVQARLQPLAGARLGREGLLRLFAAARHLGEQALGLVALGTRRDGALLGFRQRRAGGARSVLGEHVARLVRLALEPLVQLGGLGLALEWPQPRARLALHVERAREILLRALQLELGPPAALAVLAEPRRLLDQQPALAGTRHDDLLDLALRDDRVHLLAEPGVGQHFDDVDEPAARAVQAVLALSVACQPAHDRDLGEVRVEAAVRVVDHDLDLGGARAGDPVPAREDHVLHQLPAHRQRGLLAERPQHCIGDVRLARAVRADDHGHAGAELELGSLREGLEALHRDRAQMH